MKSSFEYGFIEAESLMKKGGAALINNVGKVVAAITLTVAVLVTFTDVSFLGFESESFTSTLAVMLVSAYLMYFSLEDAGEKLGEESDSFKEIFKKYDTARALVNGGEATGLRAFCSEYSKNELEYRKGNALITHGLTREDYEKFLAGEHFDKRTRRIFARIRAMKAIPLTPRALLSGEKRSRKSELCDPERFKLAEMLLRLLPSVLCMTLTVSVMLTAKDGLSAFSVIEGIFKLSTLPIIGFRGYASGYSYVRNALTPWIQTKTRLLEAYLSERAQPTAI